MRILYFLLFVIVFLIISAAVGLYPIVFVDSIPILTMRTWKKVEMGARNFLNAQLVKAGEKSIDFNARENSDIRGEIARNTLSTLIEDAIIARAGKETQENFEEQVKKAVGDAAEGKNLSDSVRKIYGFTLKDFKKYILYPQARVEVLRDALGGKEQFSAWLMDAKKRYRVRLLLVPYGWDGEKVR